MMRMSREKEINFNTNLVFVCCICYKPRGSDFWSTSIEMYAGNERRECKYMYNETIKKRKKEKKHKKEEHKQRIKTQITEQTELKTAHCT